jgi:general secretion pathway protein L
MSRLGFLASAVTRWLAEAAAGFAALAGSGRASRVLRWSEQPDGAFRVERGRKDDWEVVGEPVVIAEGAFATPPDPALRALMRGAKVEIALQIGHFIVRPLELPARAAQFLEGVVRTQIDRVTPWTASEAAIGATAPENLAGERIVTYIVATPRARLAGIIGAVRSLRVDALTVSTEVEGKSTTSKVSVLTEHHGDAERQRRLTDALAAGLGASVAAAVVAIGAWSYLGLSLDGERESLEAAISAKRAALLAQHGANESDAVAALDQKKRAELPSVLALESLSAALPDGAYLTDIHLELGKLEISGLTDDAPGLIRLLEQSRPFSHAAFSAPTTHSPNEAGERFHIEARVASNWVKTP